MLIWVFVIAGAVILDQLSKWLIVTYLPEGGFDIIKGVLRFTYVENRGAAFGMLSDHRWVFIVVSTLALAALGFYLFKYKPGGTLARMSMSFIIGGGIGNMIDRALLSYVVDFIDFCAFPKIWMWVFNVADAFVCVGAGMLMLYLVMETVKEIKSEKAKKAQAAVASTASEDSAPSDQDKSNE